MERKRQAEINSLCLDYLLNNKEYVKSLLNKYVQAHRDLLRAHDVVFVELIDKEFTSLIKSVILVELARHLPCDAEELIIFTESFNVSNYVDWL